ncbi:uncharacterized protein LOC107318667 isoform X2 [Coturnix japonica]|uniref:uncharacterized protein LOC107318667 isoform X2 n=1 Tax=Coturnix japonica TaxID=93934 RepID=UPI0007771D37|nr:uncharacterized protein LOC107318667 isoform X2 [Coturnix japonica]
MSPGQGGLSGTGGAGRDSLGTFLGAGTASNLGSCSLGTAEQQGDFEGASEMDLPEQVARRHHKGHCTSFLFSHPGVMAPVLFVLRVSSLLRTLQDKVPPFLQPQYWLRSWMCQVNSSKKAVAGAASTAAFFLCEGLLGQHFDMVPNGVAEPQPGDLFLFPLASGGPGWWGAHAGVYCGDGEIIHLEGTSGTSPTGIVAKHGKSHLVRTRGPAKVLRMKGGLDAAALQWRIRAAMDMVLEYDAVTCNCIHFALALLGLGQLAGDMMFPALQ